MKPALENNNEFDFSPEILASICGVKVKLFLDSGCEVSCLAEQFYNENKQSAWKNLSVLPVCNLKMITASGRLTSNINKQILLPIQIQNDIFYANFLIVPKLIKNIIVGCDFLLKHRVKINFENFEVTLENNDKEIKIIFDGYSENYKENKIEFVEDTKPNVLVYRELIKKEPFCNPAQVRNKVNKYKHDRVGDKYFPNYVELTVNK